MTVAGRAAVLLVLLSVGCRSTVDLAVEPPLPYSVLVTGGAGTVGRYTCQMARLAGAEVITTVSSEEKARHSTAERWVNYREVDVAEAVMEMTGGAGIDRVVDVDFAANQAASLALLKPGCVIAAYASPSDMEPRVPFYSYLFRDITVRMLIAYLIPPDVHARGAADLARWIDAGELSHAVVASGGLDDAVAAHEKVEAGAKLGSVVIEV